MTTIVDSVFNNEAIVSRVLEKTSKNSISNLDLRVRLFSPEMFFSNIITSFFEMFEHRNK